MQDAKSCQAMLERLEQVDAFEGIRRGLEQMKRGDGLPAEQVFAEFLRRDGSPDA